MRNVSLGSGDEAKQRMYLGAGDSTTDGARQSGGFAGLAGAALARIAIAISLNGVSARGGITINDFSPPPEPPNRNPEIIES